MVTGFALLQVLGGCNWKPWGSEERAKDDGGVVERDNCTLKVSACRNSCHEADLGWACTSCCERNGKACDRDDDYSFYECPNKE